MSALSGSSDFGSKTVRLLPGTGRERDFHQGAKKKERMNELGFGPTVVIWLAEKVHALSNTLRLIHHSTWARVHFFFWSMVKEVIYTLT